MHMQKSVIFLGKVVDVALIMPIIPLPIAKTDR